MMKAVVADPIGGPENLKVVDLPEPEALEGKVVVAVQAAGVNFLDVYFRTGLYKAPESPVRLGNEAAGVVINPGNSSRFKEGDRIAFAMARGTYAERIAVPEPMLVPIPDSVSFEQAAAVMLQGMTAHYLTHSTFNLQKGHTCLVHAAAGGTGLLLVQIAKRIGATVIGTVGTPEKAQLASEHGADHVINYNKSDFVAETKRITDERGVDVVYDSVGASTFSKSLDCLRPRGLMVSFGQSSGAVGPVDPLTLTQRGSLFLTRPSLADHSSPEELLWRSGDLFRWIADGSLKLRIHKTYPLSEAAEAHRELEGRHSTGKLLLKP